MPRKNQSSTQNRSNRKGSSNSKIKRARRRNNKKTRAERKQGFIGPQQRFALSECSLTYLKCVTNPFDPKISGACIPDLVDLPSSKYRVIARGTAVAGTAGVAFMCVSPRATGANDVDFINFSTSAFAGNTIDVGGIGVGVGQMAQTPYPLAALGPESAQVTFRIVGLGLRARYTGTELNRGGRIIIARGINNFTSFNNYNAADLLALRTSVTVPVTRRWHSVAYLSTSQSDTDYRTIPSDVFTAGCLAIFADGMVAGQGFEWECVSHLEYVGTLVNITRSHTDLPGMSAIRDAVNVEAEVQEPGPGWFGKSLEWISTKGVSEMSGPIARIGGDLLRKQLGV